MRSTTFETGLKLTSLFFVPSPPLIVAIIFPIFKTQFDNIVSWGYFIGKTQESHYILNSHKDRQIFLTNTTYMSTIVGLKMTIYKNKHHFYLLLYSCRNCQGRQSFSGARGKKIWDKNVVIASVPLSPTFSIQNFGALPEKRKYFARKNVWGPQSQGTRGNPPPPLSAALQIAISMHELHF
jgi:hypothetical protein